MKHAKKTIIMSAIASTILALSACGSSSTPSASSSTGMGSMPGMTTAAPTASAVAAGPAASGPHNKADVQFATDMISHHAQAIQMSDLVLGLTNDAKVKALATKIKAEQSPEIASMTGWLKGWKATVPDASQAMADGMAMNGMMSSADMNKLASASASSSASLFLTMMPEHHQGAIDMAKQENSAGSNPEAKQLAQSIIDSQTAEIAQMKTLLASIN
jgi:uncharacterized protein (DUF305 family)